MHSNNNKNIHNSRCGSGSSAALQQRQQSATHNNILSATEAAKCSTLLTETKATTKKSSSLLLSSPVGLWWFLVLMIVILMAQQQPCECRYLPTRSHGDDLDKLRELMLQILESSNEEPQQQRPPNEANGNTMSAAQRANWINKLQSNNMAAVGGAGGSLDAFDVISPRKYAQRAGLYDNGRYY